MFEEEGAKGKPSLLQHIDPIWSGYMTYRSLVPAEKLLQVCGQNHRVMDHATIVSYDPVILHHDVTDNFVGRR